MLIVVGRGMRSDFPRKFIPISVGNGGGDGEDGGGAGTIDIPSLFG